MKGVLFLALLGLIVAKSHDQQKYKFKPCKTVCKKRFVCTLIPVFCRRGPCPERPLCVPKTKPGNCPPRRKGYLGICVNKCNFDAQCSGNFKCCSNGCGRVCVPAVSGPPPRPKPQVSPPRPKPQVSPPRPKPQVSPPRPKPQVSPPRPKPQVSPPRPKPQVSPPRPRPPVRPRPPPRPYVQPRPPVIMPEPPRPAPQPTEEEPLGYAAIPLALWDGVENQLKQYEKRNPQFYVDDDNDDPQQQIQVDTNLIMQILANLNAQQKTEIVRDD